MIGLPIVINNKEVAIQFRKDPFKPRFVYLNVLRNAILHDSDIACLLNHINEEDIFKIFQVLFITSGCDFVSYFVDVGKITFLNVFFKYCGFITKGEGAACGKLYQTNNDVYAQGLLSFYRLIGCVYFERNKASLNNYRSPIELFDDISESDIHKKHSIYLQVIRKATWNGTYEDELLPTDDALKYHWMRTCWVSLVWGSAYIREFQYPDISQYGWKVDKVDGVDNVSVIWDSEENINQVKKNVHHLKKRGCGCKRGCLRNCSCKKEGKFCVGCRCQNCENKKPNETSEKSDHSEEPIAEHNRGDLAASAVAQDLSVPQPQEKKKCGCKKSKCLKRCPCKLRGDFCNNCKCTDCGNKNVEGIQQVTVDIRDSGDIQMEIDDEHVEQGDDSEDGQDSESDTESDYENGMELDFDTSNIENEEFDFNAPDGVYTCSFL